MKEISGDISATYQPGFFIKIWYLLYNFGRGIRGGFTFTRAKHWQPKEVGMYGEYSPMRVLTDLSFQHFIQEHIKKKEINVLDIGAGTAYMRGQLAEMGYSGTYTGVDVYRDSQYSDDAVPGFQSELVLSPIEDFTPPKKYDLVMSVTALEHIPDDFKAVQVARESQSPQGVQVHIVPGFWSLFLYLLHGYRQYNCNRLGKMFDGQEFTIYRLGGLSSFLVHFFCVTIPDRFLHINLRNRAFYPRLVKRAIKFDRWLPFCGYGFVVVVNNNAHD